MQKRFGELHILILNINAEIDLQKCDTKLNLVSHFLKFLLIK